MVRDALGVDAVIVSTHESERGRGVQITAALEEFDEIPGLDFNVVDDSAGGEREPLAEVLSYHGVPAGLAVRLNRAADGLGEANLTAALAGALDRHLAFDTLLLTSQRPIMLVGPSGVGKSVTAAKLAARRTLAGENTGLLTTDTVRAGAVAQLKAFADLLRIPLQTAEDSDAFSRVLDSAAASCPLVVDTPGTNPFDEDELRDLRRFIEAGEVEPVLVLAAGGDAEDAADIAHAFGRLGCRRMIVTRLDAARRLGAVLVAADAGDLAFTEVSVTPSVAQGLKPVNPMSLARVLYRDPLQTGVCALFREGKS